MDCVRSTGFLFWKKACGHPSIGACGYCHLFICQMHGGVRDDGLLACNACYAAANDTGDNSDSGSGWSFSFGSSDSSSSDSSSSDSGGGDSGGGGDGGGGC